MFLFGDGSMTLNLGFVTQSKITTEVNKYGYFKF